MRHLDELEPRTLLANSLATAGGLRVVGSGARDNVLVRHVNAKIVVTHNGRSQAFPAARVKRLFVDLRDGDDKARLATGLSARVNGGDDDDTILLGGGDDTVFAQDGHDRVQGGGGNDQLRGGEGEDTLLGDAGDDTLVGGKQKDTLVGGAGADYFNSEDNEVDELFGGPGFDRALTRGRTDTSTSSNEAYKGDDLEGVEDEEEDFA